jgi:cytochrome c-type biogenesis protein CcmH
MVWFVLAGMAAFAVLAAIWPVLRVSSASDDSDPAASEAAFYKAQLDEIQRDVERGQLPQTEAAGARAEVARRLLAVHSENKKNTMLLRTRARLAAAVLVAVGVPAIAFPLYALLGQPQLRDEPLASREPAAHAGSDI